MIVTRDENCVEAVRDGEVVARALRDSPGSLWRVVFMDEVSPAPHVKISRRLPHKTQRQLLHTILEQEC